MSLEQVTTDEELKQLLLSYNGDAPVLLVAHLVIKTVTGHPTTTLRLTPSRAAIVEKAVKEALEELGFDFSLEKLP